MKTISDLPKYLETYNIIYLVNESRNDINQLYPNYEFTKIDLNNFEKAEQLDRQLKLNSLLSDNKLFLIDSVPIQHYNYSHISNHSKSSPVLENEKIYKCIADNFNINDSKLVIIDHNINKYVIKISSFIAKVNKNNSIKIIKNKYAYFSNNWR